MSRPLTCSLAPFPGNPDAMEFSLKIICSNCNGELAAKFKCEANYITIVPKNNALLFRWNYGTLEFLNWKTLIKFPFIHTIGGKGQMLRNKNSSNVAQFQTEPGKCIDTYVYITATWWHHFCSEVEIPTYPLSARALDM